MLCCSQKKCKINPPEIRDLHNWWLDHIKYGNISIAQEVPADTALLPKGPNPIWIDASQEISDTEILQWVEEELVQKQLSVTVSSFVPQGLLNGIEGKFL